MEKTLFNVFLLQDKTKRRREEKLWLTVSSDQSFNALASALPESVHHEEQQREDEKGRDAADNEPHAAGHRVKQAVSVCSDRGNQDKMRPKRRLERGGREKWACSLQVPGSRQVNLQHSLGSLRKCWQPCGRSHSAATHISGSPS